MISEIQKWFEKITNTSYTEFFRELVDKLLGPTGAQIVGWVCLILLIYLLLARRARSVGVIIFLYITAFCLAYIPAIIKILGLRR
ncbi:hypothetical protein [Thermodesulfovibrio yellowstonii]|uniref:hypothetical protein n=1 Tax=Thermodesulfovibrio yellowstonii TaxID=28262 RepID=UPI003C7DF495